MTKFESTKEGRPMRSYKQTLSLLLSVALCLCGHCFAQTTQPLEMIAVWHQPVESFAKWKDLGINTMFGSVWGDDQVAKTPQQYAEAAHAMGFVVIDNTDAGDAYEQPDEADGKGPGPDVTQATYAKIHNSKSPRPVFQNLDGRRYQWTDLATFAMYGRGCDWYGFDRHVFNTGDGAEAYPLIAAQLDAFRTLTPAKKTFFIVECSDQCLSNAWAMSLKAMGRSLRGPTPDEMEQEVRLAVAHGVSGIVYFPDRIGAGDWEAFDNTTAEIRQRMKLLNASLTAIPPPRHAPATTVPSHSVTIDGVTYVPTK
jgi:hypothetical protein